MMANDNPNRDDKGRWLPAHAEPGPGRNSKYQEWMPEQAHRLALLGLTDRELAAAFGITLETYYVWKQTYPAFSERIESGRTLADANVAQKMYKRATGMTVYEDRIAKNSKGGEEVVRTAKEIPPDTRAAIWWLSVRQRDRGWAGPRDTGTNGDQPASQPGESSLPKDDDERQRLEQRLDELMRRRQNDDGAGRK